MDRKGFAEILNSIEISEGCSDEILRQKMLPIGRAIQQMIPDRLFRYRSCSDINIEAFERDKVYAVTADMFNDPYDTLLRFDPRTVKQALEPLLSKDGFEGFKTALSNWRDFPDIVKQNFSEEYLARVRRCVLSLANEEDIEAFLSRRKEEFNCMVDFVFPLLVSFVNKRTSTISCFSETIESVTMWSHYANYHKGFALAYDLRCAMSNSVPNVGVFPVIYDDKRYDGTLYAMWECLKFLGLNITNPDMLSHIKCVLYKSCQWEYEKEWRLIDSTIRDNIMNENITCVTLKPMSIYYGMNISSEDKNKLHEIARNKGLEEYDMYIDFASDKYEMLCRPCS